MRSELAGMLPGNPLRRNVSVCPRTAAGLGGPWRGIEDGERVASLFRASMYWNWKL